MSMRLIGRAKIAILISPLLLFGVMAEPAQAFMSSSCTFIDVAHTPSNQTSSNVGYTGIINFSSTTTPLVSYRIVTNIHGNHNAAFGVNDYGTTGYVRTYSTNNAIQDAVWHAIQGPYNRRAGGKVAYGFSFRAAPSPGFPLGRAVGGCTVNPWIPV
jgi:hypothetical protein